MINRMSDGNSRSKSKKDKMEDGSFKYKSGYTEKQRKEYQALYKQAASEASKKYPDSLKPKSPGYSKAREARKVEIERRYDKAAAELASKRNYGDSDVGSVKYDVAGNSQRRSDRAAQRVNSPVKGVRKKISESAAKADAKKEAVKRMIPKKRK